MSATKFTEAVSKARNEPVKEGGIKYTFYVTCKSEHRGVSHMDRLFYHSYPTGTQVLTLDVEDVEHLEEKYIKQVPAEKKKKAEEDYLREKEELEKTVDDLRKKLDEAITKMKHLINK